MILSEVVEEIVEKAPTYLSVSSIIRKINQVRDRLIRNFSYDLEPSTMDLLAGEAQYPLPCPPSDVEDVIINGRRYHLRQLDERTNRPYYYFLNGTIGIYPVPYESVIEGLMIFHKKSLPPLTINDMDGSTGFDSNFDMLLVYGVLIDMSPQTKEFRGNYESLLYDYRTANSGLERYVINERW